MIPFNTYKEPILNAIYATNVRSRLSNFIQALMQPRDDIKQKQHIKDFIPEVQVPL